jgi:nitrite reductase/ring-hydroxylating ferredoxin subunit
MYSMLGLGVVSASAWLGGELVYRLRIGVNHTTAGREPQDWAAVGADAELAEGQALRVEVNGDPVLLYRHAGAIYATSAVCSHAGGPLDEGMFDGTCVQCPWHDSVFDLRSGEVVHGPATYHLPAYDVRTTDGQIEIRVRQETAQ